MQWTNQEFMMWGIAARIRIDINAFGNIKCYFCDKWKMQHFYITFFLSKPMGALTTEPLATPLSKCAYFRVCLLAISTRILYHEFSRQLFGSGFSGCRIPEHLHRPVIDG